MAKAGDRKIKAEFFATASGKEPVRETLLKVGRPVKTDVGSDILHVELNWRLDRPYVDQLVKKKGQFEAIYEVRSTSDGQEYRTLFFVYDDRMVLVHFFQKKTQKTPKADIELAVSRMRAWVAEEKLCEIELRKKVRIYEKK